MLFFLNAHAHCHIQPTANDQGEAEHESASNAELSGVASTNGTEDTDEQTEDADEETSTDSKEVEVQKRFTIGCYCARRSEVFHELTHWEVRHVHLSLFLV